MTSKKFFPVLPHEIQIIKVRKQGRKNDASKEFKIRRFKAEQSLNWLKNNSPEKVENIVHEIIGEKPLGSYYRQTDYLPSPFLGLQGTTFLYPNTFFTLAFPALFPYGSGDFFFFNRPIPLSSM